MNVKKLMINTLLMGAVAVTPVGLSSCDDDDGGGNGGPSVSEGQSDVQISGTENKDLTGEGATFTESSQSAGGQTQQQITISFADTSGDNYSVSFVAAGDNASLSTGTYGPLDLNNPSNTFVTVNFFINGNSYASIENGNVDLLTKSDENASASFNDIEVSSASGDETITVSGEVNAVKKGSGGGGDNAADLTLSGAVDDEITFDQGAVSDQSQPVEHRNVTVGEGQNAVSILIVPQDAGTGQLDIVKPGTLTGGNADDGSAAINATVGGDAWTSTGNGNIDVSTNESGKVEGNINDVELESPTVDDNVTLNGSINVGS